MKMWGKRAKPIGTHEKHLYGFMAMIVFLFCTSAGLGAQTKTSSLANKLEDFQIKGSVGLQLWSTYSYGGKVFDENTSLYSATSNRINTQLRRSRFSLSGKPYSSVDFKITASLDLVGHDVLSATEAGGNNAPSPQFRLWEASLKWQLSTNDLLHFSVGYFVLPFSRESITGAMRSTSFEKPWSQNYIRRHLTGSGPGRAAGLMLGGQTKTGLGNFHLSYEFAIQNPTFQAYDGNSGGRLVSPLLLGRLLLHFGDPESEKYSRSHKVNYFGERQGLSLGLSAAHQGQSAIFTSNSSYGADVLLNYNNWQLDGEFYRLLRADQGSLSWQAHTGFLRLGHNFQLKREMVLQAVSSYWFFRGPMHLAEQVTANQLKTFSGQDSGLEIGANLYFNPDLKLSLFYVMRQGNAGELTAPEVNNNFFQQTGVGAIARGNYLGLAWVIVL